MTCEKHEWLFSTACPACAKKAQEEATVTAAARPKSRYSVDPVVSAEQRKAEYKRDEEQGPTK